MSDDPLRAAPTSPGSVRRASYGTQTIGYTLSYAERRTLTIRVHPDLRVTAVAPIGALPEEVDARVARRAPWILRRLRQYETYLPHLPERQYVSGETHRYLGRQVRLKVVEGTPEGVVLGRNIIQAVVRDRGDRDHIRALVLGWYRERAEAVLPERLAASLPRVQALGVLRLPGETPRLVIRAMSARWGSATAPGRVTLNVKLIQMPVPCIDYVILHELCHLAQANHSPEYYRLLDRALPDWRARRERLNAQELEPRQEKT